MLTDDKILSIKDISKLKGLAWIKLIDRDCGADIPRRFAEHYSNWKGFEVGDLEILKAGYMGDPYYFEIWSCCLHFLYFEDSRGKWSLYLKGHLYAVNDTLISKWNKLHNRDFWREMENL